jgi:hypothetical protein
MGELSAHRSYDDWVDCRHGAFMGLSIGGEDAQLVTVGLGPFLEWCDDRGVRPSESNLDAFALHLVGGGAVQAEENAAAGMPRAAAPTQGKPSISIPLRPKSASRSARVDL